MSLQGPSPHTPAQLHEHLSIAFESGLRKGGNRVHVDAPANFIDSNQAPNFKQILTALFAIGDDTLVKVSDQHTPISIGFEQYNHWRSNRGDYLSRWHAVNKRSSFFMLQPMLGEGHNDTVQLLFKPNRIGGQPNVTTAEYLAWRTKESNLGHIPLNGCAVLLDCPIRKRNNDTDTLYTKISEATYVSDMSKVPHIEKLSLLLASHIIEPPPTE